MGRGERTGTLEGLPYYGDPVDLKKTDDLEKKVVLKSEVGVRVFSLWKESDLEDYKQACQKVNDGLYQLSVEERKFSEKDGGWLVLMRWIEPWWEPIGDVEG